MWKGVQRLKPREMSISPRKGPTGKTELGKHNPGQNLSVQNATETATLELVSTATHVGAGDSPSAYLYPPSPHLGIFGGYVFLIAQAPGNMKMLCLH